MVDDPELKTVLEQFDALMPLDDLSDTIKFLAQRVRELRAEKKPALAFQMQLLLFQTCALRTARNIAKADVDGKARDDVDKAQRDEAAAAASELYGAGQRVFRRLRAHRLSDREARLLQDVAYLGQAARDAHLIVEREVTRELALALRRKTQDVVRIANSKKIQARDVQDRASFITARAAEGLTPQQIEAAAKAKFGEKVRGYSARSVQRRLKRSTH